MKTEELMDAMNHIDPDMIGNALQSREKKTFQWKTVLIPAMALALVFAFISVNRNNADIISDPEDPVPDTEHENTETAALKELHIAREMGTEGMGFEGEILPADTEPDFSGCDDTIAEMPVLYRDLPAVQGYLKRTDTKQMESVLYQLAGLFKENVQRMERSYMANGGIESITAYTETMMIVMDSDETAACFFKEPVLLEEGYSIDYDAEPAEAVRTMQYLLDVFGDVISFRNPVFDPGLTYDYSGASHVQYFIREGEGNGTEQRLAQLFDRVQFGGTGNKVDLLRIWAKPDDVKELGMYPVITADEAVKLYMEGVYRTTHAQGLGKHILRAELVYYSSRYEPLIMPYYRFLVELEDMEAADCFVNTAAVYVPAVDPAYYRFDVSSEMPFN